MSPAVVHHQSVDGSRHETLPERQQGIDSTCRLPHQVQIAVLQVVAVNAVGSPKQQSPSVAVQCQCAYIGRTHRRCRLITFRQQAEHQQAPFAASIQPSLVYQQAMDAAVGLVVGQTVRITVVAVVGVQPLLGTHPYHATTVLCYTAHGMCRAGGNVLVPQSAMLGRIHRPRVLFRCHCEQYRCQECQ